MDADALIEGIHPLLKQHGFKKSNATWRREQGESIAIFNVQKSQWGGDRYYVNLGTYFRAFGSNALPTENKCHVRVRLPVEEPIDSHRGGDEWFRARAALDDAAALAEAESTKGLVFKELRRAART